MIARPPWEDVASWLQECYRSSPHRTLWDRLEAERPATYFEENIALGRRREAAVLRRWLGDALHGLTADAEPPAGGDLTGLRVLDAGCGRGRFALELARAGARVTAVDQVFRFSPQVLRDRHRLHLGDSSTPTTDTDTGLDLTLADFRDLLLADEAGSVSPTPSSPAFATGTAMPDPNRSGGADSGTGAHTEISRGKAEGCLRYDILLLRHVLQDYAADDQARLLQSLAGAPAGRLLVVVPLESRWSLWLPRRGGAGIGSADPTRLLRQLHLWTPFRLSRQEEVARRNFRSWIGELRRQD